MSELYPGSLQIPAMLYSKAPGEEKARELLSSKKYIGQEKIDGAWYQLEKTDDGNVYLFSRSISKKTGELSEKIANVPHIKEWAEECLPNGTTLVGEIYVPGGKSNDVTKIMGALPDKAIERQKEKPIQYYIHDMIRYNKTDMLEKDFEHRYSDLCEYIDIVLGTPSWMQVAKSFTGYDIYDTALRYIRNGAEGCVFKLKSGLYVPGKRPAYNFKVKEQVDNLDFVITGLLKPNRGYDGKCVENWEYLDPDGTPVTRDWYYGLPGGISVGCYDDGKLVTTGRVSSGLTNELKEQMRDHSGDFMGAVCEIQAMSIDKENLSFRHPRFIQMRPDKNPNECTKDYIFG
jgi:ATP-dependent DNA ligase